MFEGVVATLLNRYLGKYIQDLDTENLNVGIFSGDVQLSELKLKPEALYELDLPIEVKVGTIGRVTIHIPWSGLYSQSVSVDIQDVYLIAGPVTDREYDPEKEKRLTRAAKRNKLEYLEAESFLGTDAPDSRSFFENLATTIMNNLQVHIHNVHIRYEDSTMNRDAPFACGICIQGISVETTNSKWKVTTSIQGASSVYQMLKVESLSVYVNPTVRTLIGSSPGLATSAPHTWRNDMRRGLDTFSLNNEEFDFVLKPIAAKVKVIVNKSNEARVPKLLVDFVLQDAATQLSRQQYLALISLCQSFQRINLNRKYRQFWPGVELSGHVPQWWQYAYKAVLEQRVHPYTWQRMAKHRMNYRKYRDVYAQSLLNPTDTELKLDLQQCEDQLDMLNIIIAREHAKIQLHRSNPERVYVYEREGVWWRGGLEGEARTELRVMADKGRGLWAQLSSSEKAKLYEAIGYVDEAPSRPDKPKQYIEHKVNFTLANCNLSLVNRGREILVLTLAQFLASVETRPSARAFKLSARVESFVVEGASVEHDLVPIITADNILTGNTSSNFLAIDFEKNPLASEADYGLAISLESVEAVYHEHAVSELMSFMQAPTVSLTSLCRSTSIALCHRVQTLTHRAIARHKAFQLNLDLKLPYLVIPELGSLQKGGNMAVVDLGHIRVMSELQPSNINLEDATQMELEERLYDRFHMDFSELQILFCDSGEEWRDAKKQPDSEYHLLPKVQCQVVFSNSVRPEYRQLPRHKLNVTVSSLKVNLSDRKIGCVLDFLDNLPLPTANTVHVSVSSAALQCEVEVFAGQGDWQFSNSRLAEVKATLVATEMAYKSRPTPTANKAAAKMAMLEVDKSFISSEHSDEEMELWARTVDLPGFDDNVSPNNAITMLLRFVIGEIVIQLCRSSNRVDKPYLMLRVTKVVCDTAIMEYGPAVQATLGSVQLVDKLHVGLAGQYLELVATQPPLDIVSLLYRKVRADCPDFKSHFHSVEQSLVVDFSSISVILHREAFVTLNKYLQYLLQKVQSREVDVFSRAKQYVMPLKERLWNPTVDPPIPPGATKFSYSTRLSEFRIRLCDTDMEFLEFKIGALESDCMFKANERMVLRFYLSSVTIDDLSDMTLYPKVLAVDEQCVVDLKYVRHSPRLYKHTDVDTKRDDVKSDGSLKLHVGRIQLVLFYKMFIDIHHFMEPFVRPGLVWGLVAVVERRLREQLVALRGWATRLHLSLDIQGPSLLLPQKLASPNLIILNTGDLSVENFFKEVSVCGLEGCVPVVDNILVRLEALQLCRAVMTLAGSLHVQEPIIEPISVRLDVKRAVAYHTAISALSGMYVPASNQLLLYRVTGIVDNIRVNLGQRDLATLLSVWSDNFNDGRFIGDVTGSWQSTSPLDPPSPSVPPEDPAVRKLAAFFSHSEQVRKEASINLTFDGLQLFLFSDMDEVLSSPVRDLNHGLCKLETGEATLSLDNYTDHSLELKMALQSCCLEDIRPDNHTNVKKIFQCHGGDLPVESNSHVCVSSPPIVDVSFRQSHSGDCCVNVLVERTRLNLSVAFLLELGRFVLDAWPSERPCDGGVINHGYVGDTGVQGKAPMEQPRPPSSADSTSGYFSSGASCVDDQAGLSVSLQLRRPEVMLFAGVRDSDGRGEGEALLLRMEFLLDYSRHPGHDNLVCSLSGLHILSNSKKPQLVLHPCDLEFSKTFKVEEGLRMVTSVSTVDVRLSAGIVHTLLDVMEEINLHLQTEEPDPTTNVCHLASDLEDLWSPKKIAPQVFPQHPAEHRMYGETGPVRSESLTVCLTKLRLVVELDTPGSHSKVPVLMARAAMEASLHDWSSSAHMQGEVQLQVSYYNAGVGSWEPLVEPQVEGENVYRPWEVLFKVFQAKAYPVSSRLDHEAGEGERVVAGVAGLQGRIAGGKGVGEKGGEDSETSTDEQEPEAAAMTFIRRRQNDSQRKMMHESVSMVGYPADSDSENEEGVMEKLACAIGHLFTGDSSDGEASESEESSGAEPSAETEDASELETTSVQGTIIGRDERAVFLKKHSDSVDSGLEAESVERLATYVLVESRDRLELTVTPVVLGILSDLVAAFTRQAGPSSHQLSGALTLINDLTPHSTVTLLSKTEATPGQEVVTATYSRSDSLPSSPSTTATADLLADHALADSDNDIESIEDGLFTYSSCEQGKGDVLSPLMRFPTESVAKLYNKVTDQRLRVEIPGFEKLEILCPRRTVSKVNLLHTTDSNKTGVRYHLVSSIQNSLCGYRITVRSPLQIRNETSYAMGIYYKKPVLEALGIEHMGESMNPFEDTNRIAIVEPDETYNVPLYIAYHCKLYLLPAYVDSYHVSDSGLWWQDLAADLNMPKDIFCVPKEEKDQTVFSVRVLCEEGVATSRASRLIPNYLLRLLPPLAVHNRLPYAAQVQVPSIKYEVRIEAGEKANIYFLNLLKMHKIVVEVPAYLGIPWQGSFSLSAEVEEKIVAMATEQDTEGGNKQLGLNIRVERNETCNILLHAPYWIINKTGLPLQIRASLSDVVYEAQSEEPLLFCYRKQRRRCVRLRAYHSSWSSAFSLDTVGCSGLVVCRDRERKRRYRILLTASLSCSSPHLTRIVTLLPNFLVSNDSRRPLRFMEDNERADLWIDLAPSQCVPFWPDTDSMRMFVKFRDSKVVSQHFPIANLHQTVLRMDRGCGLSVEVSGGGERPFHIVFRSYLPGDAPVRVDNLCEDLFLKIHQQQLGQVALLSPYQSMLYTWDDPSKERCLLWNVYNKKCKGFIADFNKDGYGQERVSFHMVKQQPATPTTSAVTVTAKLSASLKRLSTPPQDSSSDDSESDELTRPQLMRKTRKDKVVVFWVSYLEGQQRVLLFTQDERVAYHARAKIDAERSSMEVFLSVRGIGLSLVNNACAKVAELAYISATDSAAVWEVNVAHKWKMLTLELASWIEERWKLDCKKAQMKEYVHVDFEKMHMTKPFYGELRRRYNPAVWVQYRKSQYHTYLHLKLHRLQVDNQMLDAVFPTVLNPTPVPLHIVRKVGIKPSLELAVLKRHRPSHNQDVYKFIKVLVQEFSVRLDKGFILSLYGMLSCWLPEETPAVRIRRDIAILHQPATTKNITSNSSGALAKVVVEVMHLSPLKLQLSLSPRGSSVGHFGCVTSRSYVGDLLHLLLDNIAPSLSDVKDIKLKTAFYETRGRVVTLRSEVSEVVSHYSSQLCQQLHVLVLGIDVLGNPYALVSDFTEGFGDLFYEPPLGVLESPEEFGEGLAQAAQVMLGHCAGGAASTNTLLISSLTHTISFDNDFRKRRRLCLQLSSELPDALLASSRTFELGVALSLTGIITRPSIEGSPFTKHCAGSQQEGVEGFFRGVGKGLMGLLTKPSGGVTDCVAMANDGIKRASEMGEDVVFRIRLPRYSNPFMGVKPFSVYEATGRQLLAGLSKGHYADTDVYWAHAALGPKCKSTLLVTLQHVFLVEKCRVWGVWEIDWMVRVDDIMAVPTLHEDKLVFKVRQDESFNFFSGDERFIQSKESAVLQWLRNQVETVLILNMEDKPCPSDLP